MADSVRDLPHNLEAEQAILGAAMLDGAAFDTAAGILDDADWWRDTHRTIWRAMRGLHADGTALDLVTVRDALGDRLESVGGPAYIAALTDGVPRSTNVAHYARIVASDAIRRFMLTRAATAAPNVVKAAADRLATLEATTGDDAGPLATRFLLAPWDGDPTASDEPPVVAARLAWERRWTLLHAGRGVGKSELLAAVARAVTNGGAFLNRPTVEGPVLWIGEEAPDAVSRRHTIGKGAEALHYVPRAELDRVPGSTPLAKLTALHDAIRPSLTVIDSIKAFCATFGKADSSPAESDPIASDLTTYARTCALLTTAHQPVDNSDDGGPFKPRAFGGGPWEALPDAVLCLAGPTDGGTGPRELTWTKRRWQDSANVRLHFDRATMTYSEAILDGSDGEPGTGGGGERRTLTSPLDILDELPDAGTPYVASVRMLADRFKGRKAAVCKRIGGMLETLRDRGMVERVKGCQSANGQPVPTGWRRVTPAVTQGGPEGGPESGTAAPDAGTALGPPPQRRSDGGPIDLSVPPPTGERSGPPSSVSRFEDRIQAAGAALDAKGDTAAVDALRKVFAAINDDPAFVRKLDALDTIGAEAADTHATLTAKGVEPAADAAWDAALADVPPDVRATLDRMLDLGMLH